MLIKIDEQLPADAVVEISIRWPYLLQDACLLQLAVHGRVVATHERGTAVHIERYEFRTRARRPMVKTAAQGGLQAVFA